MKIGTLIDQLHVTREKIRELNAQVSTLEEAKKNVEEQLLAALKADGVTKATGKAATASISTQTVAQIEDIDRVYQYVLKNKCPFLFERRVSNAAFRELLAQRNNKAIPGLKAFDKETISLRSL